jgi:hypothetical protein
MGILAFGKKGLANVMCSVAQKSRSRLHVRKSHHFNKYYMTDPLTGKSTNCPGFACNSRKPRYQSDAIYFAIIF